MQSTSEAAQEVTSTQQEETPEFMLQNYKSALEKYTVYDGDSDEYDSSEEEEIIKGLKTEEREEYEEYKQVFIKQLVHYGRTMPLEEEIRRHMFGWLPGCPTDYVKVASDAVKKLREELVDVQKKRAEKRKLKLLKQHSPVDDDVLFIKFMPGIGPIVPIPEVKQEPEEQTAEESATVTPVEQPVKKIAEVLKEKEVSSYVCKETVAVDSSDEEGDDTSLDTILPKAVDRKQLVGALKNLTDATHQQALAYEKLVEAIPKLEDDELREIQPHLPTPVSAHLPLSVKDFLEREEPLTVTHVIAIGSFYLECHLHSKYPETKKPTKRAVAQRFGITEHKFIELTKGIAYAGGSKTSPRSSPAEKKRAATTITPSKKTSKKLKLQLERLPDEEDEPAQDT